MPLTSKGNKILLKLNKRYGDKGESIFYAMINEGKLKGVEKKPRRLKKHKKKTKRK